MAKKSYSRMSDAWNVTVKQHNSDHIELNVRGRNTNGRDMGVVIILPDYYMRYIANCRPPHADNIFYITVKNK